MHLSFSQYDVGTADVPSACALPAANALAARMSGTTIARRDALIMEDLIDEGFNEARNDRRDEPQ
jgi:hypothetical protein